jgi:hypothetical protein
MIEYEVIDAGPWFDGKKFSVPPFEDKPCFYILDKLKRWQVVNPSVSARVRVFGISDEPLECDVAALPSFGYLF